MNSNVFLMKCQGSEEQRGTVKSDLFIDKNKNIFLVGFMGSGKTTIGNVLSTLLHRRHIDLDSLIEKKQKTFIRKIFASRGEAFFRQLETNMLLAFQKEKLCIISTGGGILTKPKHLGLMKKSGIVIFLKTSLHTCVKRISHSSKTSKLSDSRPLFSSMSHNAFKTLFKNRQKAYLKADIVIETDHKTPQEIAKEIVKVLIKDVSLFAPEEVIAQISRTLKKSIFILTDKNVAKMHLQRYLKAMPDASFLVIKPGETSKNLRIAEAIWKRLLSEKFERDDIFVSLGGGVITDLGGFVAASYKRGLCHMPVATSTIAAVDAAIGGKTAVNLEYCKNAVGFFYNPHRVFVDVFSLLTLNDQCFFEGVIEAVKTAIVANKSLFLFIEQNLEAILDRDLLLTIKMIFMTAETKQKIVSEDFFDRGQRLILNLGHTVGHAIEASSHKLKSSISPFISHGFAVGFGIKVAAELSLKRKLITLPQKRRIDFVVDSLLSTRSSKLKLPSFSKIKPFILQDKKIVSGKLRFVLFKNIGQSYIVQDMNLKDINDAYKKVLL